MFRANTIFLLIMSKGHTSANNVDSVRVFILCTHLMMLYMKFHENSLGGIEVIERTRISLEKNQRGIGPQKKEMKLQFLCPAQRLIYICNK